MIEISLKFVFKGRIDNKLAMVRVMARHQTGDESYHEPMITKFTEAFMCHKAALC